MRYFPILPGLMALSLMASSPVWAEPVFRLQVDGLACPFCAYGLEKKLTNTDGVQDVDIRINDGVVLVTVDDGATFDEARARRIVKDAGFTLRGFEKTAEAQ